MLHVEALVFFPEESDEAMDEREHSAMATQSSHSKKGCDKCRRVTAGRIGRSPSWRIFRRCDRSPAADTDAVTLRSAILKGNVTSASDSLRYTLETNES
jgi:hypothetical protein